MVGPIFLLWTKARIHRHCLPFVMLRAHSKWTDNTLVRGYFLHSAYTVRSVDEKIDRWRLERTSERLTMGLEKYDSVVRDIYFDVG